MIRICRYYIVNLFFSFEFVYILYKENFFELIIFVFCIFIIYNLLYINVLFFLLIC